MSPSPPGDGASVTLLDLTEALLRAQLQAVRQLRQARTAATESSLSKRGAKPSGRSQMDKIANILLAAGQPLHISEIIARAQSSLGLALDRESVVSALTKRVARKDRFTRTAPNTFALLPGASPSPTQA